MTNKSSKTWVDCLQNMARQLPDKTAYIYLNEHGKRVDEITFSELDRRARSLAFHLLGYCTPKDRVLLLYPPGLDYVVAFYGCLYAGLIAVPLYSPQNNKKIELIDTIANNCDAKHALSTDRYVRKIQENKQNSEAINRLNDRVTWTATDLMTFNRESHWQYPEIDHSTVAYLQFTSGSTSVPKGIELNHEQTLLHAAEIEQLWQIKENSSIAVWLPHFHDLGQVFAILQPVYIGITCTLMSPASFIKNPYIWLKAISDHRATHTAAPNFSFDLCVDTITEDQKSLLDLSCLQVAANGAEPVRADTLDNFYQAFKDTGLSISTQTPSYGLAEATLVVTSAAYNSEPSYLYCDAEEIGLNNVHLCGKDSSNALKLVCCGGSASKTDVSIVNPDTLQRCEPQSIGEIWVHCQGLGSGYWKNPLATDETFRAEIIGEEGKYYMRTGDLGFLHKDELYITGRIKDLIIIRGSNHYPQDIELSVESSHPLLRKGYSAAFSLLDDSEEKLIIAVERERYYADEVDYEHVLRCIREAVSKEHNLRPHKILILRTGSISKTTSGKIQRQKCKKEWLSNDLIVLAEYTGVTHEKNESKQEPAMNMPLDINSMMSKSIHEWLVQWFAAEMKTPDAVIDVNKSFSACGLSSMDSMLLHENLEGWLKIEFSPDLIWDSESIDEFVEDLSKIKLSEFANENRTGENAASKNKDQEDTLVKTA